MAHQSILNVVRSYLQAVNRSGIQASRAVLFGSWTREEANAGSDIDLIVIAPEFDRQRDRKLVDQL